MSDPADPDDDLAFLESDTRPPNLAPLEHDLVEAWPSLRRKLANLLTEGTNAKDFQNRLTFVAQHVQQMMDARQEDSLFILVQMLTGREYSYSATHALMAAATCHMMAPMASIGGTELMALLRAALTMNISMTVLHDELSRQAQPLYEDQRLQIKAHPVRSCDMLKTLEVTDPLWLGLVLDHHESPDGTGYPRGKTELGPAQQLLRMADLFIAKISPRASRRGLAPRIAVGSIYLEAQSRNNPLGGAFARQIGMYPPGSYVRLRNNEVAVVVRRGERVNTPLVMALIGADGLPLSVPDKRDTTQPAFSVSGSVSPEDVKIRPDLSRLLKRV
jgi:HD-GYP domain-containing protein (c-di-GMP phosphodiesterase class II)